VLRWSRIPVDHDEFAEWQLAERTSTEAALAALPARAKQLGVSDEVVERMRADLEQRLADIADQTGDQDGDAEGGDATASSPREEYNRLHAALLGDKRAAVVQLRDAHEIDDIVLRRVQGRLDAEEVRLTGSMESE
jgi:CPA1 family monovalent cation:H+ antiporter